MVRIGFLFITLVLCYASMTAQEKKLCITQQPKPEMPHNAGTLDAQTSVYFRVEFLANGTLGQIALVKSIHIKHLDELATTAVRKISFEPKRMNGEAVAAYRILHYRYSWKFGWKVEPGTCKTSV